MKTPLRILHLEANPEDAELVQSTLAGDQIICSMTHVQNRADFVAALERGGIDLVLADSALPELDGLAALEIVRAKSPELPYILVAGSLDVEAAVQSLKHGAMDCILKKGISRLVPAVQRVITEAEERAKRRRAEEIASRERCFSDAILNSQAGIFYLLDDSLKFLRWNKNFERVTGYSSEEFTRLSPLELFTGGERDYIAGKIQEVFTAGAASAEARLTAKDGAAIPYYFIGHKILMEGKVRLIGTGIDISERKLLEAQFIEAQKMEVVGQLASGVAHDFNNILAVIIGYGDLMVNELATDNPLRKYIDEIRHAAQRASALTRQLLVFSRKQTVQPVVLDPNAVVADTEKILRRLIDANVELKIDLNHDVGRIKADVGYLGQVLMNLIVNARDAMPNGGKLSIATSNVTPGGGPAYAPTLPGNYVLLTVSDTGMGMTDEVKKHLFEAFFTTKPKGKGTGLGLTTCQTIVKQCGGHIQVKSELGQGTTFNVYFPRVDLPLDISTEFVKKSPLARGTETLLLVEDEPSVRHLARSVLQAQGYEVLSASNGQDGLHVAREHKGAPIRLVITDVIMPQMGGRVMAEWLQTTYPNLKILFTSGYMDDAIMHHGVLEAGVAFLPKPYTPAVLAHKVREMLDDQTHIPNGVAP